jgi:hypothetical protein
VLTPERRWVRERLTERRPAVRLAATSTFRLHKDWPDLPPEVLDLAAEVGRLEFTSLPIGLGFDLEFVRRTGLVDCAGAAYLLYKEAQQRGLPVRFSMGLVVVVPYASVHCWTEFLVEDTWVPVDPLMINALIRWGLLDGERWHFGRSIGAILGRLSNRAGPIATHNGEPAHITMTTSCIDDGSATGEPVA